MKSIQKITRIQLNISKKNEFLLFGLVSAEPDYKLSQHINKKFRITLKNAAPVKISDSSGPEQLYSRFSHTDDTTEIIFNLYSNRSGNNFLLKKLKNVDYIFQLHDPENYNNADHVTISLREIESISAVFTIDPDTLREKNLQYITQ
jgi:hypothetical protein